MEIAAGQPITAKLVKSAISGWHRQHVDRTLDGFGGEITIWSITRYQTPMGFL